MKEKQWHEIVTGWRAANDGASKRRWFVLHVENYRSHGVYHENKLGQLIRFGSFEAADRRARQLNSAEAKQL